MAIVTFKSTSQTVQEEAVDFQCLLGQENYQSNNFSFNVFWVPHTNSIIQKGTEVALGRFAQEFSKMSFGDVNRVNAGNPQAAFMGLPKDNGVWANCIHQAREGTILRVFMKAKRAGTGPNGWAVREYSASRLIRLRKDAAYQSIVLPLTANSKSVHTNAYITGNFDLLTLKEAEEYGYRPPPYAMHTFDDLLFENVGATVNVIRPESQVRAQTVARHIVSDDGKVKTVIVERDSFSFGDDSII